MSLDEGWSGNKPTSNNTHFEAGGTSLRVGSLYGARSFLADPDTGWLSGVTYRRNWTPGINTAECWKVTGWSVLNVGVVDYRPGKQFRDRLTGRLLERDGNKYPETVREFLGWQWQMGAESGLTQTEPMPYYGNNTDPAHDLGSCHCGYHGYLRGSLDFATDKRAINGIVRAFGRVKVGTRGFRAQHAEIVALYIPDTDKPRIPRPAEFEPFTKGLRFAGKVQSSELVEKISTRYPNVPVYADLDDLLALHDMEGT